ncbi:threonine efflux protein [Pectobacterium araliae]|uniref:LysE family translocator n=1 Tax=Pectobacterium araliae TaxID=3073862 RepID=UPI00208D68D0|nr:threonine efflux protein [Pectobacterium carotovorum subsp. carotovorum]
MFYAVFIYIMAVISPGPNFILVSRYSALGSVKQGLAVTLGICSVGACFSILSLLGLSSIIHVFPSFSKVSVVLGALYLIYIAYIILRSTFNRETSTGPDTHPDEVFFGGMKKAYFTGALTNVFNMKTIAFMISIWSGFLAVTRSPTEQIVAVIICSALEFSWYFFVALIFGRPTIKRFFFRYRTGIDRGLAVFLTMFATQNIYSLF